MKPGWTRRGWMAGVAGAALAAEPVRLPKAVRIAILGFDGHTSEITGRLSQLPDIEVAAVSDPDPAVTARAIRNPRLAKAKQYTDYRRMLDAEKLDLVAVCNPNGERAEANHGQTGRGPGCRGDQPLSSKRAALE